MAGTYEAEYRYALANPAIPACKTLLELAQLYQRHPDEPTLGLIQGAVEQVRRLRKGETA